MNARMIKTIGYGALLGALLAILAFAALPTDRKSVV